MKQSSSRKIAARTTLLLNKQTVRNLSVLTTADLEQVQGGMVHTSFSCGNNLCTTH